MAFDRAHAVLQQAQRIAALTGAGISAESGVPTFRGEDGLWEQFRPEDLATPQAFARNPELVWRWYSWRRARIAEAKPNPGHLALAEIENRCTQFTLITQNVDGLHHEAGSRSVLELHGNIWTLRCTRCMRKWIDRNVLITIPPSCECGAIARPDVVWFGEDLPSETWRSAERAVESCNVLLVVGTSALVYPAAGLVPLARSHGAKIIQINTQSTGVSGLVDYALTGPAGKILPQLVAARAT